MEFEAGGQPRAVRAKEKFARAGAFNGRDDVVKAADARSVRVDVGIAHQLFDDAFVRAPIVGEAAEVRDNEVDVGILLANRSGVCKS